MPIGVRVLAQWPVDLHESVLGTAIVFGVVANAIGVIRIVVHWSVRVMFAMAIKSRFRQIFGRWHVIGHFCCAWLRSKEQRFEFATRFGGIIRWPICAMNLSCDFSTTAFTAPEKFGSCGQLSARLWARWHPTDSSGS